MGAGSSAFLAWLGQLATTVAGPIINAFVTHDTNKTNTQNVTDTNQTNKEIHQADNDFQAAQTQAAWERDDTAHQREVADLKAAGLSPLANTTGNPVTSPLGSASPIAMQAPQVDATSLMNSIVQAGQLAETKRHNMVQEGQKNIELVQAADQLQLEADQLDLGNRQLEQTIKYQSDLIKQQADTLAETRRANNTKEMREKLAYQSEQYWKEVNQQTGGNIPYKDYYDLNEYESMMKAWTFNFDNFIRYELKATRTSESENDSQGIGVGAATVNVSGQYASGISSSEDISKKQDAMLKKWYAEHPMPVYHANKWEREYK